MSTEVKPIRSGSSVRIRGNLFYGAECVVVLVEWLDDGQRYVLKHPHYTCPLFYSLPYLELIPDVQ